MKEKENAPSPNRDGANQTSKIGESSGQPTKLQVLFPIHTATAAGDPKQYVIDGDSVDTLDILEAAGHQIVDANGNWTGIMAEPGRIIHHECKSHQEVWALALGLYCQRRQKGDLQ